MSHPARGIPFNLDHEIQLWQRHIATEAMECQDLLKSQLARLLGDRNPHLYQQDADRIVDIVLDEITAALKDGGRVELRGFGAFSVRSRDARMGRNPRSGATVEVTAKFAPTFRCSKDLHRRLNKQEA